MSKFKNKKALALAISAAMAGVGIVGVAAACAPSKQKTKPTKRKEGSSSSSGSTNPGTSSGSNTNPGAGSVGTQGTNPTNPVNPGSPNETNKPSDSGSTNPGTSSGTGNSGSSPSSGSGSSGTQGSSPIKPITPANPGSESTKQQAENAGSNSGNTSETNSNTESKPNINSDSTSQGGTTSGNSGSNSNSGKGSSGTQGSSQTTPAAPANPGSSSNSGSKNPDSESTTQQTPENTGQAKPITVSLNDNEKLVENNGDFTLSLNFENANGKFVEVELSELNEQGSLDKTIKSKEKVEVNDNKAKLTFNDVNLLSKYKIKSVNIFDKKDDTKNTNIELSSNLKDKQIPVDTKILTPVSLTRNNENYLFLKLTTNKLSFEKIKNKRLVLLIDKGDATREEAVARFTVNKENVYYLYPIVSNNSITFVVSSDYKYTEKGNYQIKSVWLDGDSKKTNLLKKETSILKI